MFIKLNKVNKGVNDDFYLSEVRVNVSHISFISLLFFTLSIILMITGTLFNLSRALLGNLLEFNLHCIIAIVLYFNFGTLSF